MAGAARHARGDRQRILQRGKAELQLPDAAPGRAERLERLRTGDAESFVGTGLLGQEPRGIGCGNIGATGRTGRGCANAPDPVDLGGLGLRRTGPSVYRPGYCRGGADLAHQDGRVVPPASRIRSGESGQRTPGRGTTSGGGSGNCWPSTSASPCSGTASRRCSVPDRIAASPSPARPCASPAARACRPTWPWNSSAGGPTSSPRGCVRKPPPSASISRRPASIRASICWPSSAFNRWASTI